MSGTGFDFSRIMGSTAVAASVVGEKTSEGGFDASWRLAEGWYPGTVIGVGNKDGLPYTQESDYSKNGNLRLPFNVLVDGTIPYILANGVPGEKLNAERILAYVVPVARNMPLTDNHPPVRVDAPNGQGKVAAAWTKDPEQIKKYSREPGRMMEAQTKDGPVQTFYGTLYEIGAVLTDLKTKEVKIDWAKVPGARVYVYVNKEGYGAKIQGKSLDDAQRAEIGTREAPVVNDTLLTANPDAVVKFKALKWDKADDKTSAAPAGNTGPVAAPPPKVEASAALKAYMLKLIKTMTDGDPSAKALVPVFQAALRDASAREGTAAGKFSELHTVTAQHELLGNTIKILVSAGLALPAIEGDEPWTTVARNAAEVAQVSDPNEMV